MAIQPPPSQRLAFGAFELNASTGELRKGGLRVRLPDQPFQILLMLLTHAGDVVTREQLRNEIWGEGTFVDFEHGLGTAVNKLRQALGDSAESPRFIETLRGRGYRFIAPVTWDNRNALATSQPISGAAADDRLPMGKGSRIGPFSPVSRRVRYLDFDLSGPGTQGAENGTTHALWQGRGDVTSGH